MKSSIARVLGVSLLTILSVVTSVALLSGDVSALVVCTKTWVGGVDDFWTTAGNWSPSGVPASTDDVCIIGASTSGVFVTGSQSAKTVTVGAGKNLQVRGGSVGATLTATDGITNAGTIWLLSAGGASSSVISVTTGTLINNGTVRSEIGAGGPRTISADLVNNGTVTINTGTTLTKPNGIYSNTGTINIASTRTLTVQGGTFTNASPGTINGGGVLSLPGVTFFGTGTVTVVVNNTSGGQFNPGLSPGLLNITGNYTQDSGSTFRAEIGGSNPGGGHDQLNITGSASLAGNLVAPFISGFVPSPCDAFTVMTYSSRTGAFGTVTAQNLPVGWSVRAVYTATGVVIVAYNTNSKVNIQPTTIGAAEGGTTGSYNVCLATAITPTASVAVNTTPNSQVTTSPASLIFTNGASGDWDSVKTLTVTAVDDAIPEGNHTGSIAHTSSSTDLSYNNLALPAVTVNITDNDADVSVSKTDSPDPVQPGGNITYTVVVSNGSPTGTTNVVLTDTLPAGVAFVSATSTQGTCSQAGGTVTCNLGNLASGASATVTIVVTANTPGTITNTASVTASQSDPNMGNNTATATTKVNNPPASVNDGYSTNEDVALNVAAPGVLGNDSDADGDTLTTVLAATTAHGSLTLNANGSFTYTPNTNFNGTDTFTYRANDGAVSGNTATVTITVNPVNDAPTCSSVTLTTAEDTAVSRNLASDCTDPDTGDTIAVELVSLSLQGTTTLVGTTATYTPNLNFNGSDSFAFRARDSAGATSSVATVNITITPVNDAPAAANDAYSTNEDTALNVTAPGVLANDTDVEGNPLTAVLMTGPAKGTLILNANGSFTYTPNANVNGTDSFTYKANDGAADSNTARVTLSISPVNDPPVAANDAYSATEDTVLSIPAAVGVLGNDTDADGHVLTAVLGTGPANGALTLNADGAFTYKPKANFNGADSFTYMASDSFANSNVATVTITVAPVNDAPVAADDRYATDEDVVLNVAAPGVLGNDTDVEGTSLTVASVIGPANGSVTVRPDGSFTYTPNADFFGTDTFRYRAADGALNSNQATVTITVNPVNDPPLASPDAVTTAEDAPLSFSAATLATNDSPGPANESGQTLAVTGVSARSAQGGAVSLTGGTVTYAPAANFNGVDTFTYTVADNGTTKGAPDPKSATGTVTVTVTPVNDPPVANAQSVATAEDTALAIILTGSDVEGAPLTFAVAAPPAKGSLSGVAPNLSYTPNPDYNGPDSFTFTVNDGSLTSAPAKVSITVTPVNDAPVANAQSVSTAEDTAVNITLTGSDVDNVVEILTFSISNFPLIGSLSGTGANVVYTPNANVNGSDSFTFTVSDGSATSVPATVSINVTPVNDAPIATNDSSTTLQDTPVTISVLANDSDVDGDALTVSGVTQRASGSVAVNPDGTVKYTPDSGFVGSDSFNYTISDGKGGNATATVNVTVTQAGFRLAQFVAFSTEFTWLRSKSKVISGDVGANTSLPEPRDKRHPDGHEEEDDDDGNKDKDRRVEVRIGEHVEMQQSGSNVVGDTVWLRSGARVYNVHYNEMIKSRRAAIVGDKETPLALPVLGLPALPTITPGAQDIEVKPRETRTLAAGSYRKITVRNGGALVLSGGTYHVSSLDVRTDAKLLFKAKSEVRVKNEMDTDAKTYVGPDPTAPNLKAHDIVFYVEGKDDKGRKHDDDHGPGKKNEEVSPTVVQIGVKNTVAANIYAPNGTVWLKEGAEGTGAFIGKRVRIGEKVELTLDSAF